MEALLGALLANAILVSAACRARADRGRQPSSAGAGALALGAFAHQAADTAPCAAFLGLQSCAGDRGRGAQTRVAATPQPRTLATPLPTAAFQQLRQRAGQRGSILPEASPAHGVERCRMGSFGLARAWQPPSGCRYPRSGCCRRCFSCVRLARSSCATRHRRRSCFRNVPGSWPGGSASACAPNSQGLADPRGDVSPCSGRSEGTDGCSFPVSSGIGSTRSSKMHSGSTQLAHLRGRDRWVRVLELGGDKSLTGGFPCPGGCVPHCTTPRNGAAMPGLCPGATRRVRLQLTPPLLDKVDTFSWPESPPTLPRGPAGCGGSVSSRVGWP